MEKRDSLTKEQVVMILQDAKGADCGALIWENDKLTAFYSSRRFKPKGAVYEMRDYRTRDLTTGAYREIGRDYGQKLFWHDADLRSVMALLSTFRKTGCHISLYADSYDEGKAQITLGDQEGYSLGAIWIEPWKYKVGASLNYQWIVIPSERDAFQRKGA